MKFPAEHRPEIEKMNQMLYELTAAIAKLSKGKKPDSSGAGVPTNG